MPVQVRTARLRRRLSGLQRNLASAVAGALASVAEATVSTVQSSAAVDWADGSQVGFDVQQFNRNIESVEVLPQGGFGILNVQRMGTESDYEQIAGVQGAWHMGTKRGSSFGRFIAARPSDVDEVAAIRQSIWGERTPQWFLLNDGNAQFVGSYAPRAGTHTIERAAFDMVGDVRRLVSDRVNSRLRSIGVLI